MPPSTPKRDMGRSSPRWRSRGSASRACFYEFKAISQSEWMVLEAFSVSHGKASAYLPVIDLLHGYFEIIADDDDAHATREDPASSLELDPRFGKIPCPYLFGCSESSKATTRSAQMDAQIKQAPDARSDQAHPAARVASISR